MKKTHYCILVGLSLITGILYRRYFRETVAHECEYFTDDNIAKYEKWLTDMSLHAASESNQAPLHPTVKQFKPTNSKN